VNATNRSASSKAVGGLECASCADAEVRDPNPIPAAPRDRNIFSYTRFWASVLSATSGVKNVISTLIASRLIDLMAMDGGGFDSTARDPRVASERSWLAIVGEVFGASGTTIVVPWTRDGKLAFMIRAFPMTLLGTMTTS
jgi:hypothetical protein